ARIHKANLINFGILPLTLANAADYDTLAQGERLRLDTTTLAPGAALTAQTASGKTVALRHDLTAQDIAVIRAGGLLNWVNAKKRHEDAHA
ncbi:MAG: aconitate hydratase, partial [Desulfomicrobiaceae bacterium]|nr:aconitate hydratase [Desulfomicrobiaceae bacterium]